MIHQLKLEGSELADAVLSGDKNYEVRIADRNFSKGDILYMSLFDKQTGKYVEHEVSDYLYLVTNIIELQLEDGKYNVMGIHMVCSSRLLIHALSHKFYMDKAICKLTLFGGKHYTGVIHYVSLTSIIVSDEGGQHTIPLSNIVWISPSEGVTDNRSIYYDSINFTNVVDLSVFTSYHNYQIFRQKAEQEKLNS